MSKWMPLGVMALAALCVPALATNPVEMRDTVDGCTVQTAHYRLQVDVRGEPMVRWFDPGGKSDLAQVPGPWVEEGGRTFRSAPGAPRPHFHPLRSGPYLVELHLEQIVLRSGEQEWPGLAELSLYCQEERVYVVAALLRPKGEWVNRGLYVYRVPETKRNCPEMRPSRYGVSVRRSGDVRVRPTVPEDAPEAAEGATVSAFVAAGGEAWEPGEAREVGVCLGPAEEPAPDGAFTMAMGEALGYDRATGLFRIVAQTSGTPDPPAGLRAGARYVVRNDGRARRLLVDQRDPWGGICGGILRDGAGLPLPVLIQFGLNFPELNREAGEPGWATLTYPLELQPNESREIRAEHLYRSLSDRECLYLTSLDNIGDPLLLQTTVGRCEAHTLTTGAYPGARTPGNELRVNDFRRIYTQEVKRSASAILPTFFGYYDEQDRYQGLMPGLVTFRETSPFLTEYTVGAATEDGAVRGELRVWQAAHADVTRIFTEVTLRVDRTVRLSRTRPAALFLLRHHAFNPMAFMKYAFTAADGSVRAGDLSYARTVVENGTPMGEQPFGCLYRASNGIDDGVPCSDITGNPGFVVLAWDVTLGRKAVRPGAYVFCTGQDDPDGAYARDLALVPAEPVAELPAGSRIHHRAVQMIYGNNSSGPEALVREREVWRHAPLQVKAAKGTVISADPPEVRAVEGRVEVAIVGGVDWIPMRVVGFDPARPLQVRQTDARGSRLLGPGAPDEPWYSAWRAGNGRCGFTFLVRTDPQGGPVRIEAWQ